MPSIYAHYRFGSQLLPDLPADIRRCIQRFRRLYNMGLQGPDFFFFYRLGISTDIGKLGHELHYETGDAFFSRICARLAETPNEAAAAYLYGLLAHYCLDSLCHPYVHEQTDEGPLLHNEMETEFDRYLLTLDGFELPHTYRRATHMKLTRGEYATVALFYPPATGPQVREAIVTMALISDLLTCKNNTHRYLAQFILKKMGGQHPGLLMPTRPNSKCTHLNDELLARYQQALTRYGAMLDQLRDHMTHRTPLGKEFTAIFG